MKCKVMTATYSEIQEYVKKKHGKSIKTCWIAHAKEKCGLHPAKAPNRQGKKRLVPCPDEKFELIKQAFKHYRMIQILNSL